MKPFKYFITIVLSFTVIACAAKENDPRGSESSSAAAAKYKRYGIKNGIVEYEYSGAKTGTETLYFDDWGMKEAVYGKGEMKVMGISTKENKLNLMIDGWSYAIDMDKKTGTKIKTPLLEQLAEQSESGDLTKTGEKMMIQMGGEKIGQEIILGKTCDVWEVKNLGIKIWLWEYVPLNTESNFMGQTIKITAVKTDFNTSINSDKFGIPANIKITEGQDLNNILNRIKGKK